MRIWSLAFVASLAVLGCKKDSGRPAKQASAAAARGTVGPDGIRRIEIVASNEGYTPDRIPGKPGEKLKLVFTRTTNADCLGELKTPEGKLVPLPLNTPVEIDVTVPAEGEVGFACGMDMFHGVIVADKAS